MPYKFENDMWYYQPGFLKFRVALPYWSQHFQGLRFKSRTAYLPDLLKRYSGSWHEEIDVWSKIWHSYFMDVYFRQTDFEAFKKYKFVQYLSESDLKDIESTFRYFHDKVAFYNGCLDSDYSSYTNNRNAYDNIKDMIKDHNREIWKWYKLPGYKKPIKQPAAERHYIEDYWKKANQIDPVLVRYMPPPEEKYTFRPIIPYQHYYGRYIVPGHKGHPGFHWHQEFSDYIY